MTELAGGAFRDPYQWAVITEPDKVLFAQRPTREEAEAVAEEYDALIRSLFGTPTIVAPTVTELRPAGRAELDRHHPGPC